VVAVLLLNDARVELDGGVGCFRHVDALFDRDAGLLVGDVDPVLAGLAVLGDLLEVELGVGVRRQGLRDSHVAEVVDVVRVVEDAIGVLATASDRDVSRDVLLGVHVGRVVLEGQTEVAHGEATTVARRVSPVLRARVEAFGIVRVDLTRTLDAVFGDDRAAVFLDRDVRAATVDGDDFATIDVVVEVVATGHV